MNIKIVELYPNEIEKLKLIENEKSKWFLSKLRDEYSDELIKKAIDALQNEEFSLQYTNCIIN